MKQQRLGFVARVEALEAQVQRRDREIERLGQMLEGGRPFESVYAETLQGQEERRMAQLGTQVDLLQHTNRELQERLEKAHEQGDERSAKVRSLCRPSLASTALPLLHSEFCLPPSHSHTPSFSWRSKRRPTSGCRKSWSGYQYLRGSCRPTSLRRRPAPRGPLDVYVSAL
jgi:hypothetical protein